MMKPLCFFCLICIWGGVASGRWKMKTGPWKPFVKSIDDCSKEMGQQPIMQWFDLDKTWTGEEYWLNFKLNLTQEMTTDFQMRVTVDQLRNKVWKENFIQKVAPLCDSLKTVIPQLFTVLQKQSGLDDCPFPAGEYKFENMSLGFLTKSLPAIIYGDYRGRFLDIKDGKNVGCFRFEAEAKPLN